MNTSIVLAQSSKSPSISTFHSQESITENLLNFLFQMKWYVENPGRITKIHHHKLLAHHETSLARLVGDWFWKSIGGNQFDDLELYREAIGKLTKKVLSFYCPSFEGILEIGAGYFPLADDLFGISDKTRSQIHISDISPKVIAHHKKTILLSMQWSSTQCNSQIKFLSRHIIVLSCVTYYLC